MIWTSMYVHVVLHNYQTNSISEMKYRWKRFDLALVINKNKFDIAPSTGHKMLT